MTTRGATRRSSRRAVRKPTAWYNDGIDLQSLAASTSLTAPLFQSSTLPEGFLSGFTVVRLIATIAFGPSTAATIVNAVGALYVATRDSLTTPPNLNADLLDYYWYGDLQSPSTVVGAPTQRVEIDLRSARRVRGEDRGIFFRVTNNEATLMQVGIGLRAVIQRS